MSNQEMLDRLRQLERENAALKMAQTSKLGMKVSANKGCLSVYGLGRFPVTLYASQWTRLLDAKDSINSFIEANKEALAKK